MSGRETRDRQVMTLLVQLFGRDVMDRLAGAGFDAPAAMARAGAEKLAAEAGIPIAIARRVAIVVEESPGPAPTASSVRTDSATRAKPVERANSVQRDESDMLLEAASAAAPPRAEPAARPEPTARMEPSARREPTAPPEAAVLNERRPAKPAARRRGEPRIEVAPATPPAPAVPPPAAVQAAAPAEPASQSAHSAASTGRGTFLDEGDPFVDDVALVSWMGLSSHQPDGRLAFTVSDTILDPAEGDGKAPAKREADEAARPERPRPPGAAPIEPPARPSTISGSFWTFGRAADPTPPSSSRNPEPQSPAATPRRRKHDGH
jgi:hypothetical protein